MVSGITGMHDIKQVGRVSGKALPYFEVVSSFALLIGLIFRHLLHPGAGFNIDIKTLDASAVSGFVNQADHGTSTIRSTPLTKSVCMAASL